MERCNDIWIFCEKATDEITDIILCKYEKKLGKRILYFKVFRKGKNEYCMVEIKRNQTKFLKKGNVPFVTEERTHNIFF